MKTTFTFLLLLVSVHLLSQSTRPKTMNKITKPVRSNKPAYLDKKDSIFLTIKERVITDLKEAAKKADPNTPENQAKAAEIQTWNEEKRQEYYEAFNNALRDYVRQMRFDFDIFMLLFRDFGAYDQQTLEGYDFRVQDLGENKYAAEFWEDGLEANSEANAIIWAKQLMERNSEDKTIMATVKATYAKARKLITDGKQPRYSKVMALLYTKEKNKPVVFNDPVEALAKVK